MVKTFADGTRLGKFRITLGTVPPDLTIQLHVHVGGVTFDDGTLDRTVTAGDFDELNEYRYRMLVGPGVPTSACHWMRFYQDGTYIEEP